MKPFLGARAYNTMGKAMVLESDTPDGKRGVVFEDDGETGYFYARDYDVENKLFVDAMHMYSVERSLNAGGSSAIRIIWSTDLSKSALLIDDSPQGVFDFTDRIGFCRDEFPKPDDETGWRRKAWSAQIRNWFYPEDK